MDIFGSRMTSNGYPVFYDESGRRWRHVLMLAGVLLMIVTVVTAIVAPAAFEPTVRSEFNQDKEFPRRFLMTGNLNNIPIIGEEEDGILNRVVRAVPVGNEVQLIDPYSNEFYRNATEDERELIDGNPYAIDNFGRPADRQLMLTFDDGPDPVFTGQLLDILSREKVPATFFPLGKAIVKNTAMFERIVREGHMVGNHTMTHHDFDVGHDVRNREELIGTDRVMRAVAGYETHLFRIPRADPDNNALGLLQAQQLGYLHVDLDLDTLDWKYAPGTDIAVPPLDGRGHVVLLHDGGGDRTETLRMAEKFIASAKQQGYTFETLAPLLPPEFIPRKDVAPATADIATLNTLQLIWLVPERVLGWLFWLGVSTLSIMTLLYLSLAFLNNRRQKHMSWYGCNDALMPYVSIVLAAYNEERVIQRTLDALAASDYPHHKLEVIVVNDGSTDNTASVLNDYARRWAMLRVIHQSNGGKSSALNNGLKHARRETEVIVSLDADTIFEPSTIRMLARHFQRTTHRANAKAVGAVAGHVKVGNRRNIITAWQSLEYISGICVTRMAEGLMGSIAIVPGACSAWSKQALQRIGGFSERTLAEDADATLQLHRLGYRVLQEHNAVAYTEAPETMRTLAKQRQRWMFGTIQVLWVHRAMMLRPRFGMLGLVSLPYALMSMMIPMVFLPATVISAVINLAQGNWESVALFAAFVTALHMVVSIAAITFAHERYWHLWIVPIYRLIYEPLRAYLLYASLLRIIKGSAVYWNKLERRNSVVVKAAA